MFVKISRKNTMSIDVGSFFRVGLLFLSVVMMDTGLGVSLGSAASTSQLCQRLWFRGLDESFMGNIQFGGVYELQNFTWDDFPVYKFDNLNFAFNRSNDVLYFGVKRGDSLGLAATVYKFDDNTWFRSNPKFPYQTIIKDWHEYDWSVGSYKEITSSSLQLECVGEDFHQCSTGSVYLSDYVIQENQDRKYVLNNPEVMYYEQQPHLFQNSRPVYKCIGCSSDTFLYYRKQSKGWLVGHNYTKSEAIFIAEDSALQPDLINTAVTKWHYYSDGRWHQHSTLDVRCKGVHLPQNETCVTNNLCQNGGSCYSGLDGNALCFCEPNWYGTTCEKRRAECPKLATTHGPDYASSLTNGNVSGSLTTFYCPDGQEPRWFLSVCQTNQDGHEGSWKAEDECRLISTRSPGNRRPVTFRPATLNPFTGKPGTLVPNTPGPTEDPSWGEPDWLWKVIISVWVVILPVLPVIIFIVLDCRLDTQYYKALENNTNEYTKDFNELIHDITRISPEEITKRKQAIDEGSETVKEEIEDHNNARISFARFVSLSFQLAIWVGLPFLIGCGTTKCGQYSQSLSVTAIYFWITGSIGYIYILIETICSREDAYLKGLGEASSVAETLNRLRQTPPIVILYVECYHMETRMREITTTQNGITTTRYETYQVMVVTHRDAEAFQYNFWCDTSDDSLRAVSKYGLTKINMDLNIAAGDIESDEALDEASERIQNRNKYKDDKMIFRVETDVTGFIERLATYTDPSYKPWWASRKWLWIATAFGQSWIFRIHFKHNSDTVKYKICKRFFVNPPAENLGMDVRELQSPDENVQNLVRAKVENRSPDPTDWPKAKGRHSTNLQRSNSGDKVDIVIN